LPGGVNPRWDLSENTKAEALRVAPMAPALWCHHRWQSRTSPLDCTVELSSVGAGVERAATGWLIVGQFRSDLAAGEKDRGSINREIARHNSRPRKIRRLRAAARRMMPSAPRGVEIPGGRPPVARELFSRPEIASEARQAPKRPDREGCCPGNRRRPSAASRAGREANFGDGRCRDHENPPFI
jgi:hypothetical protein